MAKKKVPQNPLTFQKDAELPDLKKLSSVVAAQLAELSGAQFGQTSTHQQNVQHFQG